MALKKSTTQSLLNQTWQYNKRNDKKKKFKKITSLKQLCPKLVHIYLITSQLLPIVGIQNQIQWSTVPSKRSLSPQFLDISIHAKSKWIVCILGKSKNKSQCLSNKLQNIRKFPKPTREDGDGRLGLLDLLLIIFLKFWASLL